MLAVQATQDLVDAHFGRILRPFADLGQGDLDAMEAVRSLVALAVEIGTADAAAVEEPAVQTADGSAAVAGPECAAQVSKSGVAAAG